MAAVESQSAVAGAWKAFSRSATGAYRLSQWEELAEVTADPDYVEYHSSALCHLVVETLPVFTATAGQRLVLRVLRHCLAHEPFLKEFTATLVKLQAASTSPQAALTLLRWSGLVLQHLDPAAAKKATAKVIECQAAWMEVLAAAGSRWGPVQSTVNATLAAKPAQFAEYMQVATTKGSAPLCRVLFVAASRLSAEERAAATSALLQLFVDKAIGARERPAMHTLACYRPLLQAASEPDATSGLSPAAVRMVKRSPEAALGSVAFMLSALRVDLSAAAEELMPALMQQARHAKETVRRLAVQAAKALASRVSSAEVVQVHLDAACRLLGGSTEGKLKNAQERASLAALIEALAAAPGADAAACCSAATFLSAFYKEEITEDGKLALLSALGCWLPRCTPPPAEAISRLGHGLTEKETLRRGHLRALLRMLSSTPASRGNCSELTPSLVKLVQEGSAKVAARADGVLALLALAYIAAADSSANDSLQAQGVWDAALSETSPLISPATASKLAPEDAAAAAELAGVLLALHQAHLGGTDAAAAAVVSRTLALSLLHYSPAVRAAAASAGAACAAAGAQPTAAALAALQGWVSSPVEVSVLQDPADLDGVLAHEAVHQRYRHALLALLPRKTPEGPAPSTPEIVIATMLLAHHPMLAGAARHGAGSSAAWAAVGRRTGWAAAELAAAGSALIEALINGPHGVRSADASQRAAACGALRSAAAAAAPQLFDPLLATLAPVLDRSAHDALTPRQLRVYATPLGRLTNENEDGSMIPAEIFEAMLANPSSTTPPLFPPPATPPTPTPSPAANGTAKGPRSAAAAAAAAPGKGRPGKPAAKDAMAEARAAQLVHEAAVRAGVVAVRELLAQGLAALGTFAAGNPTFAAQHLDRYAAPVTPLLTSMLVGDSAAFQCLKQLASCLPGALGWRAADIAAALRLVALAEHDPHPDYQRLAAREAVAASVRAMQRATGGRASTEEHGEVAGTAPLEGTVYTFCFPVLRAVLSCPKPTPLHEAALGVVSLHVGPLSTVPKPQSFALLYRALEILPSYRERVQGLLRALCSSLALDDQPGLTAALQGLAAGASLVRAAALSALTAAPRLQQGQGLEDGDVLGLLWLARCDPSGDNAAAASELWSAAGCALPATFVSTLMRHLSNTHADVRTAAAAALAAGLEVHPDCTASALQAALQLYQPSAPIPAKLGAAAALRTLAPHLPPAGLTTALDFLLASGLVDGASAVRADMVTAGVAVVDAAGQEQAGAMLPLFESYLDPQTTPSRPGLSEGQLDWVREGAVVFLGTLARHLDPDNPKVKQIVDTLIEVLTTPSASVQRSVSGCLPALMQGLQKDAAFVEAKVAALLERALSGKSYGDRCGAAFGLAGAVKGLGLSSLKAYGIMDALKVAVENKADASAREGSLMAFERLSEKLGRLFEPYVIHILPMLLVCFGDTSPQVREATDGAARTIMGQLSAQGVKLVLPALLKGVEDKAWRTKQGSIQLLGAMAHCAPKQLSTCLPTIVPRLGEVLSDPHPKVCSAARTALDEVGSVIRNPEVARLVPTLLAAVADPGKNNKACLNTLLNTVFVNTVDAPSLALIIPVVHRGLRERSGDVKKRAARIVGNLCSLINDSKDMAPYVPLLLPELQAALVDPLPEVRATAAKALGSLSAGMGDELVGDMTPWLLKKMHSESSAVERSGAAQGLAEVLAVRGGGALPAVLPEVLAGCRAKSAAAREGSLTLFKYLPYCMPGSFQPYLPDILPFVLGGLADEAEGVRDAAFAAGRVAVELYASSALPLLLPTVEAGVVNANWRIRQSSVELLGDLLFKVAGTTGRIQQDTSNDDEEGISVEAHGQAIVDALGKHKRNEVLALLYVARSDVAYTVRSAALHVWKTLVTNTPKTLGEILPALMTHIIESLADEGEERREVAGRCLGELVRKMGERVLYQIVPILKQGMLTGDEPTRQGVCNGMREVLDNATRQQLAEHLADLLPALQAGLCDSHPDVRAAAGGVFDVLFQSGGAGSIDSIIPSLLAGLESDTNNAQALEGLRVVLGVRPQLLSAVVPRLIRPPVTAANLRALGALAEVGAASIHAHLPTVMPPLLKLASSHSDVSPAAAAAHGAVAAVAAAVQEDGLHIFVAQLSRALDDAARRRGAAAAIVSFCKSTKLDYQEHVPSLLTSLVTLLADDDADTLTRLHAALTSVTGSIPKELAPSFVRVLKEAVAAATGAQRRKRVAGPLRVPGFCLPKALAPVLPIYLQGVLQASSAELRELAAEGLGELVQVTGEDALKPYVVQITGPLIRIVGDRFPWQTKVAILKTLGLMVERSGAGLRPFVPQLQTTFVKCLADPAREVRQCAAANLGLLTRMAPRLDNLVSDLATNAAAAEAGAKEAYATALQGALAESGDRLAPEALHKVGLALQGVMDGAGDNEVVRTAAARAQGAYAARCGPEDLRLLLASGPLAPVAHSGYGERLGAALLAAAAAQFAAAQIDEAGLLPDVVVAVKKMVRDENHEIKEAAGKAAGRIVTFELEAHQGTSPSLATLVPVLVALLGPDQHADTQRHALAILRRIAFAGAGALEPHYPDLVPNVLSIIQASSGTTKLAAERTLGRVLQLDVSTDAALAYLDSGKPGALAKAMLTEPYLRRLSRLPGEDDVLSSYDV